MKIHSKVDGIFLEFFDQTGWKIFFKGEYHDLSKDDYRVILSLLSFLEIDLHEIQHKINELDESSIFPFQLIIEAGFIQGSEYWVELAINWLYQLDSFNLTNFSPYLNLIICDKKKYNQRLRNRALHLMNK